MSDAGIQREGILITTNGVARELSLAEKRSREFFPELFEDLYDTQRTMPMPISATARALAIAVRKHYEESQYEACVALGQIFRSIHGQDWPTWAYECVAKELSSTDLNECIPAYRELIAEISNFDVEDGGFTLKMTQLESKITPQMQAEQLSKARLNLADMLSSMGKFDEAATELELSLNNIDDQEMILRRLTRLACTYHSLGKSDQAHETMLSAKNVSPEGFKPRIENLMVRDPELTPFLSTYAKS